MIRILLTLIINLFFAFLSLIACEMADQYRIFPLGVSNNTIICMELDQFRRAKHRTSRGGFKNIIWQVYPRLISVSDDGKITSLKDYDLIITPDSLYNQNLLKILKKIDADANKLNGFENIEVFQIEFGTYKNECNKIKYYADTTINKPYIIMNNIKHEVFYPNKFLAHRNLYLDVEKNILVNDSLIKTEFGYFNRRFGIGSYRKYLAKNYEITIVTLGFGDRRFGIKNQLSNKNITLTSTNGFVYNEPVLHHGHSFDYLIKEKLRPKKIICNYGMK